MVVKNDCYSFFIILKIDNKNDTHYIIYRKDKEDQRL